MEEYSNLGAQIVMGIITAPISVIPGVFPMMLAYQRVVKQGLSFGRAYKATLFCFWLVSVPSLLFAYLAEISEVEPVLYLTAISTLLIASYFYGRYLRDAGGQPLGTKQGFYLLLVVLAYVAAIMAVVGAIITTAYLVLQL